MLALQTMVCIFPNVLEIYKCLNCELHRRTLSCTADVSCVGQCRVSLQPDNCCVVLGNKQRTWVDPMHWPSEGMCCTIKC